VNAVVARNEDPSGDREWLAVLGHELRTPLSAILGYAELLEDGSLGELEGRAADAVWRIRASAEQLLRLIEGMDAHLIQPEAIPVATDAQHLMRDAAAAVAFEAESRHVHITVGDGNTRLTTRPDLAVRALHLALGAAIKVSPGGSIRLTTDGAGAIVIAGSEIDARRDDPDAASVAGTGLTGAGLRIALARLTARQFGGELALRDSPDGAVIRLEVGTSSD
jgi:signal transduction histidine kinase